MKKKLALVLVFVIVLALSACGGGGTTPANNTGNQNASAESAGNAPDDGAGGNISGNLLVWFSDNDNLNQAIGEAFTAKYPNVAIEFGTWDLEASEKMALAGPAGTGADVFRIAHNAVINSFQDGTSEPFPADLKAKYQDVMVDAVLSAGIIENTLYGAPIMMENIAFIYNKDLVDTPPETFEEIFEFAKTYNNPSANQYAMRWQVTSSYFNHLFLTAFGYQIFGPNGDDYRQFGIDSPNVAQALEFFQSLRDVFPVNAHDANDVDAAEGAFARGEVPFCITGWWQFPTFKEAGVNFGVTKFPTINGVQPRCYSGSHVLAVSSYSQNKDAAFAFVDFCVSEEGATIMYNLSSSLPALKDPSGIPGLSDDEHMMGVIEQAPYADPVPSIPEINFTWDTLKNLYTYVWDGSMTIEDAQTKTMEDYEIQLNAIGKSMNDPANE
ncbi:MAG: maltose ABC transporter substrate-binding protein [Oscillospiraceae bacterium]|nr:maltose ABC transporter substrate-binding protein [Oscillospiraceae bacterium]